MKTPIIVFIVLLCISSLDVFSQSSKIADDYLKFLKTQKVSSLLPHFLSIEQQIKTSAWPNTPSIKKGVDSINTIYKDSLVAHIKLIDSNLKEKGFSLKKSKLITSTRNLGVLAKLEIRLSHKEKSISIFIDVIEIGGKDYILNSFPSQTPSVVNNTAFTTINNINYPIWRLRSSDRIKANTILEENKSIELEGKMLSEYSCFVFPHGVISEEKNYYAFTKVIKKEDSTTFIILVDIEKGKIAKIEKEVTTLHDGF